MRSAKTDLIYKPTKRSLLACNSVLGEESNAVPGIPYLRPYPDWAFELPTLDIDETGPHKYILHLIGDGP